MTYWQPIETEPGDGEFRLYGLNVQHTNGLEWFEVHYLRQDQDTGQMIEPSGDNFDAWSFEDFIVWADPPLNKDMAVPTYGESKDSAK